MKYIQTDGYRAPEAELQNSLAQAGLEGDSGCTTAVDLWSLGIILLEMFSGIKLKETVKSQEWKVSQGSGCIRILDVRGFKGTGCKVFVDLMLVDNSKKFFWRFSILP